MGYQPTTIAKTISNLNRQWFLPAIQREFVWKPEQIISLFDSILRGYPISSFLFWSLKDENREKWEIYRFIEDADQRGVHNPSSSKDGIHNMVLVLDGQQRLTSMLVGLKGSYTTKIKYRRWDDPGAWLKQRLYLDLLKDPTALIEDDSDAEEGLYYHLAFREKAPEPTKDSYWFRVGKILDFDSEEAFDEYRDELEESLPEDVTKGQLRIFRRVLERLHRAIWKDEVIAYYEEQDQDYDRVLDIFVRANEGGTKLSKSDLLLSMVTSTWADMNARDEIYGFVDRINNELARKNNFDKDFVMKTSLVVSDLPVKYKVGNFSDENLRKIRSRWDNIKDSVERAVRLVNYFGVDRDNLTSANALIPIIYYLSRRPGLNLRSTSIWEAANADRIRRWFGSALLNGVFGGSSDTLLRDVREVMQKLPDPQEPFPVNAISDIVQRSGRTSRFESYAIDNVLALTHGRQQTFLALTLLYDERGWGELGPHQDHIFPQKMFRPTELADAGYSEEKITALRQKMNRIGNLQLLVPQENLEKQAKPFDEWIQTREPTFVSRHLIPSDPKLWMLDRFEDFLTERERLISDRLASLLSDT